MGLLAPINLFIFNFNMENEKINIIRHAAKLSIVFLPLVISVLLINYFVDPGGVFKGREYEESIAQSLANGSNVANITNCEERLLQLYFLEKDKVERDIIVLGSSRVLQINARCFPGKKFFNHGVPGGTLEDFFSICEMYERKNKLPGMIILGLDPWILNRNSGQDRWKILSAYYDNFMRRLYGGVVDEGKNSRFISQYYCVTLKIKKWLNLISFSYFQQAIEHLVRQMTESRELTRIKGEHYFTKSVNSDFNVRMADGSIAYGYGHISRLNNLEEAKKYINQIPVYSLGNFYELDKRYRRDFERFVDYLLKKKVRVIFLISPYHPYVYNYFVRSVQYQITTQAEAFFKAVGVQKHILVVGSYDPQQCGFDGNDFYDGMHPNEEAIARLIRSVI